MKKPERIFNFDSGWSIDLDKVFYIGLPEIKEGRLTLRIGVLCSNARSKNAYMIHEEIIQEMDDEHRDELKSLLLPKGMEYEIDRGTKRMHRSNCPEAREDLKQIILTSLEDCSDDVFEKFCFYDFKHNCDKFRTAWKEWITYKESLPPKSSPNCAICEWNNSGEITKCCKAQGDDPISIKYNTEECRSNDKSHQDPQKGTVERPEPIDNPPDSRPNCAMDKWSIQY